MIATVYDFSCRSLDGELVPLSRYRGQPLLIVNTASHCHFAGQFRMLEHLHRSYRDQGFSVLGFPCNQFRSQEPLTGQALLQYCLRRYGVSFPLFDLVQVKGGGVEPLFAHLMQRKRGLLGLRRINWTFTKFLIDRQGGVVRRFEPTTLPSRLAPHIEKLL